MHRNVSICKIIIINSVPFSASCKKLSVKACENVVCKDNPHFYCKLDKNYKCRCPDCDDVDYWQRGIIS